MYRITLKGQMLSGKNAIKITRTGIHYPTQKFKSWRLCMQNQIMSQLQNERPFMRQLKNERPWPLFILPKRVAIEINYRPGDLRTRDHPGILDALFHIFEFKNGGIVVENDGQFKSVSIVEYQVDTINPRAEITLYEIG